MYKQFIIEFKESYQVKDLLKHIKKYKLDFENDGVKLSKKYDKTIIIDCDDNTNRVLIRFKQGVYVSTIAINPLVIDRNKIKELHTIDRLSQLFYDSFLFW